MGLTEFRTQVAAGLQGQLFLFSGIGSGWI